MNSEVQWLDKHPVITIGPPWCECKNAATAIAAPSAPQIDEMRNVK